MDALANYDQFMAFCERAEIHNNHVLHHINQESAFINRDIDRLQTSLANGSIQVRRGRRKRQKKKLRRQSMMQTFRHPLNDWTY